MSDWAPHVTVACVVFDAGRYLMVEEHDEHTGRLVLNQPAGHLDAGETLPDAALRETREETGWSVRLTGLIGIALHTTPAGVTYHRTTFLAEPLSPIVNASIDADIHRVLWLDYDALRAESARMRSPLVLAVIERHRRNICYPLDLIFSP